jgi:phosphoglycolate phosphatase-like HAD superfamily hydrolase
METNQSKVFIFDVDGTLTDTLPAHAQFCLDLNNKYCFGLNLPSNPRSEEWKDIAKTPIDNFFRSVGFPEEYIENFISLYKTIFSESLRYASKPFEGVTEMLENLKHSKKEIGIVSSNIIKNIRRDLGERNFELFGLVIDSFVINQFCNGQKSEAIKRAMSYGFNVRNPENVIYIGDTLDDYKVSEQVGCGFIGVEYGWGINHNDSRILRKNLFNKNKFVKIVSSVGELERMLFSL